MLMNTQSNNHQVTYLLCQPQGGRNYLHNALNSKCERTFMKALHQIIDALNQELGHRDR